MSRPRTIDIHAHILDEETVRIIQAEVPKVAIRLTPTNADSGRLEIAGACVDPFPRGAWDLERRLRDMDAHGFDMQAVTACPVTFLYGHEPQLALDVARIQNDRIAALAAARPDRFLGLGTLPMQAPEVAADELRRIMADPRMCGIQIGANIDGRQLDHPAFEPVWATAEETGAFILVHPMNAVGVNPGVDAYYLKNLIHHPCDTTVAAACLVFGGVLERHPALTFCMAHGGGFAPYQMGRFLHGWHVRDEPKVHLKQSPEKSFDRLTYDTVLHDWRPLQFLVDLVGPWRVMLGSDYPFDMGQYDLGIVRALKLSDADKATILAGAAARIFDGEGLRLSKPARQSRAWIVEGTAR